MHNYTSGFIYNLQLLRTYLTEDIFINFIAATFPFNVLLMASVSCVCVNGLPANNFQEFFFGRFEQTLSLVSYFQCRMNS